MPPELAGHSPADDVQTDGGMVELPSRRGPKLSDRDTLEPELLVGRWLEVCLVRKEQLSLILPGNMNVLELYPQGSGTLLVKHEDEAEAVVSAWRKVAPGVIELGFGDDDLLPYYGEIYQEQFLYIWNYEFQEGYWFARLPAQATRRIEANRFDHTRGELHIAKVVGQSYEGVISGESELMVSGYYESGVLTMRWEDPAGNQAGYAVYLADPEWQSLTGVWWIDDYEGAPFAGSWIGRRT
jgi:hypothetical protein